VSTPLVEVLEAVSERLGYADTGITTVAVDLVRGA